MKTLTSLAGVLVAGFCTIVALRLLLADPPRYGPFICALPFLAPPPERPSAIALVTI